MLKQKKKLLKKRSSLGASLMDQNPRETGAKEPISN